MFISCPFKIPQIQLAEEDRISICTMRQAGKNQKVIAAVLGVHSSTISGELSCDTSLRGYRPNQAKQEILH